MEDGDGGGGWGRELSQRLSFFPSSFSSLCSIWRPQEVFPAKMKDLFLQ